MQISPHSTGCRGRVVVHTAPHSPHSRHMKHSKVRRASHLFNSGISPHSLWAPRVPPPCLTHSPLSCPAPPRVALGTDLTRHTRGQGQAPKSAKSKSLFKKRSTFSTLESRHTRTEHEEARRSQWRTFATLAGHTEQRRRICSRTRHTRQILRTMPALYPPHSPHSR